MPGGYGGWNRDSLSNNQISAGWRFTQHLAYLLQLGVLEGMLVEE